MKEEKSMNTSPGSQVNEQEVKVPVDSAILDGDLNIPAEAEAIVLFAHGSGSSRHSKRN